MKYEMQKVPVGTKQSTSKRWAELYGQTLAMFHMNQRHPSVKAWAPPLSETEVV